jgi:hypothetical protein
LPKPFVLVGLAVCVSLFARPRCSAVESESGQSAGEDLCWPAGRLTGLMLGVALRQASCSEGPARLPPFVFLECFRLKNAGLKCSRAARGFEFFECDVLATRIDADPANLCISGIGRERRPSWLQMSGIHHVR